MWLRGRIALSPLATEMKIGPVVLSGSLPPPYTGVPYETSLSEQERLAVATTLMNQHDQTL